MQANQAPLDGHTHESLDSKNGLRWLLKTEGKSFSEQQPMGTEGENQTTAATNPAAANPAAVTDLGGLERGDGATDGKARWITSSSPRPGTQTPLLKGRERKRQQDAELSSG